MEERSGPLVWGISLAVAALAVILVWYAHEVLLLIFAGFLFAAFLNGVAAPVARRLRVSYRLCLGVVLGLLLWAAYSFAIYVGPPLNDQLWQLLDIFPDVIEGIIARLEQQPFLAQSDLGRLSIAELFPWGAPRVALSAKTLADQFFIYSAAILLVTLIGIFVAWSPKLYRVGLELLVKDSRQAAWSDLLDQTQLQLQWWILARVTSMVITGLLVTVALWLLDFPLALAFGVLSGLLSFVPYVGPLLGLFAPVMFAAFSHDAPSPLVVASVYIVVELVESYLITPLIQRKGIPLPPALTLSAMALLGVLAGGLGVALAAPLAVAVMAVLDETWIKGNRVNQM